MEKTFNCPYCDKKYKTERTLKQHIDVYCKKKNLTIVGETSKEHIESFQKDVYLNDFDKMMIEDIDLKQTTQTIEDKLIKFYSDADLVNISLNKEKLKEFRALHLEYYKKAMLKTCINGIVQSYKTLYYVTLKIKTERNEKNI